MGSLALHRLCEGVSNKKARLQQSQLQFHGILLLQGALLGEQGLILTARVVHRSRHDTVQHLDGQHVCVSGHRGVSPGCSAERMHGSNTVPEPPLITFDSRLNKDPAQDLMTSATLPHP